jgi:hypothetical protein
MNTTTQAFFEVRLSIYAGSNERKALDQAALEQMGFNGVDFEAVKAMLQTAVLPKEAFFPFLAIRKSVQDFLATKGIAHDLLGRLFNPNEREEVVNFLRSKQEEYEEAKAQFLADYARAKSEQLEKVEAAASAKGLDPVPLVKAVADNQPSVDYYKRKMEFRFIDSSIELDSEEWAVELARINSDLVSKTVYELSRDAAKIRDTESARSRAKNILNLSSRLKSLDFYVPGLAAVAVEIESVVESSCGGVKPLKEYSQREALASLGLAKVLDTYAPTIVAGSQSVLGLFSSEASRIETLLAEDDDQDSIELEPEEQLAPIAPEPETVEDLEEFDGCAPKAPSTTSYDGAFAF